MNQSFKNMERLVRFTFQDYMDMYPENEHRWMDPAMAAQHIDHMNSNWSGGHYASGYTVLSKEEALAFARSEKCEESVRGWLVEKINSNY